MRLTRFANELINYTMPAQVRATPHFGTYRTNTATVPGLAGVIDLDGDEMSQQQAGTVTARVWLVNESPGDLRGKLDTIFQLPAAGLGRLFSDPGHTYDLRWTWARCIDVSAPELVEEVPHRRVAVDVEFLVPVPRWYSRSDATYDGMTGAPTLGGNRVDAVAVVDGDTVTVTNNGNAWASGVFTVDAGDGEAWYLDGTYSIGDDNLFVGSFGGYLSSAGLLKKNAAATTIDQFTINNNFFEPGDSPVIISTEDWSVTGVDYGDMTFLRGSWMRIEPGSNTFEVYTAFGYQYFLTINFWDTWTTG